MNTNTSGGERRIMRLPEVIRITGMCKSSIYKAVGKGRFPKPRKLGQRAVGWLSDDVSQWLGDLARTSQTDGGAS